MSTCRGRSSASVMILGIVALLGAAARGQEPAAPAEAAAGAPAASTTSREAEPGGLTAAEATDPWAVLTLGAWAGDDFLEGRFDTLLPLARLPDGHGLLLGDVRAAFADEGEQEINAGLVYRHRLPWMNAIVGANAFYDSRWTEHDNQFNQLGVGLEALTHWVDARANLYLPENERERIGREEVSTLVAQSERTTFESIARDNEIHEVATVTRTRNFRIDRYDIYEVPLEGFDAEVGVRLPLPLRDLEARAFVGYYDFDAKWKGNVDTDAEASGIKGRLELRAWNCLFADVELFEDDDLYGSDYLVSLRVRLPLGPDAVREGAAAGIRSGAAGLADRMTEMVMRDPRVQVRDAITLTQDFTAETRRVGRFVSLLLDNVIFVYGDNVADPLEDGSAEHPYNVIQEGVDASSLRNMPNVYVFGASNPYRENVTITDTLNLHGEGCPLGNAAPPTRGHGRPVVEGQAGSSLLTPATFTAQEIDRVRIAGFEITAAPFAGGPWSSPFSGGTLSPLAGVLAQDVDELTVECNRFRNLVAGVVALQGQPDYRLTVRNNSFETVGLGVGTVFTASGCASIRDNSIHNALLGIGAVGFNTHGCVDLDISGNEILGRTVDLAGIEPYALYEDLFSSVLPSFPVDHPERLPFPTLGGIAVVSAPLADIDATIAGNTVAHPALGITGLAISPNLLGAGLSHADALTRLDIEIRDNVLAGGGLSEVYDLAYEHAGTLYALATGAYGSATPEEMEAFGDMLRQELPSSLGADGGLFGIALASLGDGAEMHNVVVTRNRIDDYLFGAAAVAVANGQMRDAIFHQNTLDDNLIGIVAAGMAEGDMRRLTITENRVDGGGLGKLNGFLEALGLGLGPQPLQLPDISLAGVAVIGIAGADMSQALVADNYVDDALLGIGVISLLDSSANQTRVIDNDVQNNLLGLAGIAYDSSIRDFEVAGNVVCGGGTLSAIGSILGLHDLAGEYDPGLAGIVLLGMGTDARRFSIHDNLVAGHVLGIGAIGIDSSLAEGAIFENRLEDNLAGILALGTDSDMHELTILDNQVRGGGVGAIGSLLSGLLPSGFDAGIAGIAVVGADSEVSDFVIARNSVACQAAAITVAGLDGADMRGGLIAENTLRDNLLGIAVVAADGADLSGLGVHDNDIAGAGMDLIFPDLFGLPTPQPGGLAGVALLSAGGNLGSSSVVGNHIDDNLCGILAVGVGPDASFDSLVVAANRVCGTGFGTLVYGFDGADMRDVTLVANTIEDSLVGVLAGASRTDSSAAATPLTVVIAGNTIAGSDSRLADTLQTTALASMLSTGSFMGLPSSLLGADELLTNPTDLLTVLPGLDAILPGGFNPADPPTLDEVMLAPDFPDLLNGQGLAGIMIHVRDGDPVDGQAIIAGNTIENMENGIYAVVVDSANASVFDILAVGNTSQDNVVIGEDTTRADYTLIQAGSDQETFVELPTP